MSKRPDWNIKHVALFVFMPLIGMEVMLATHVEEFFILLLTSVLCFVIAFWIKQRAYTGSKIVWLRKQINDIFPNKNTLVEPNRDVQDSDRSSLPHFRYTPNYSEGFFLGWLILIGSVGGFLFVLSQCPKPFYGICMVIGGVTTGGVGLLDLAGKKDDAHASDQMALLIVSLVAGVFLVSEGLRIFQGQ